MTYSWPVIIILAAFVLAFLVFVLPVIGLWVRATFSGVKVKVWGDLVGMRLRRVPPSQVVLTYISAAKASIEMNCSILEAHYLAGGSMQNVVRALIAADKANIALTFQQAAAIDLAGRNIVDAVQTSVNPKVIDCPGASSANGMLDAAIRHPVSHTFDDHLIVEEAVSVYCPQLPQEGEQRDFGADFVDSLLPVKHVRQSWHPPLAMSKLAFVSYTQSS